MPMPYNLRLWFATRLVSATRESANVTTAVLADLMLEDSRSPTALSEKTQASTPRKGTLICHLICHPSTGKALGSAHCLRSVSFSWLSRSET